MHIRDKIGFGLVGFSIVVSMALDNEWVGDHPMVGRLLFITWCLPLFWMIPQVWKDNTPRCSLTEWRSMRQLGYRWSHYLKRFITEDGEQHVKAVEGFWRHVQYHDWRSGATTRWSGPAATPTAAHVLGQLNQGDFEL